MPETWRRRQTVSISRQRFAVTPYKQLLCQKILPLFAATGLPCRLVQGRAVTLGRKKARLGTGFLAATRAGQDYFSKASTDCGCWLACASMAVAACWMIWFLDSWLEAVA